jgi:pyridoxal phosphate enzyme (YggS family)
VSRDLSKRLREVRERAAAAAARAARDPAEVVILGVAKRQPAERVAAAVRAGLGHVAENFAQEARDKLPRVAAMLRETATPEPRWHFVGRLQRNKVRYVARLFDCVESVDRIEVAQELDHRAKLAERRLEVLLQVNLVGEVQKGGAAPDRVARLLQQCRSLERIRVTGLMTVPPASEDPETSRPVFAALRELLGELREAPGGETLRELSMGMSADFEVAIEEGATIARVGTAIFGPREPRED